MIATRGALHRVTPERLALAAQEFAPAVAHLPRPLVAVLVGGANRSYRLDGDAVERLATGLRALAAGGTGLAVTTSRRTGPENERRLRERLAGLPAVIWDGLNEPVKLDELVSDLAAVFDQPADVVREEVVGLLTQLVAREAVRIRP